MKFRNESLIFAVLFVALSGSVSAQQSIASISSMQTSDALPSSSTATPTASPQTSTTTPPPQQRPVQERTPPATKQNSSAQSNAPANASHAPANSPAPSTTASPSGLPQNPSPSLGSSSTPVVPLNPVVSTGSSLLAASTQNGAMTAPLTRDEAVNLALRQASTFQQAELNERIAAEDVRQSRAAFLPRVAIAPSIIYTTPSIGTSAAPDAPRPPSFIAANAVSEYQALLNVTGELDVSGRLRATLNRNVALLEAARAGTEVARRNLVQAINDAYFGLALASARRVAAEQNLAAAAEFERATQLLLSAGEVAPVDLTRARLQTNTRRDELEQARTIEAVAADSLRVFVGYDFNQPIATTDLLTQIPQQSDIENATAEAIKSRPEFAQFDAERRAADLDIRLARVERRPQITYNVSGGLDADSLRPLRIGQHSGASATIGVSIPIFDAGQSRSRERQAQLRAQSAESSRLAALRAFAQAFYSARTQALSAVTRIRLASDGIRDAESNLTASLARYRAGEASIIEVTDAQNTLITNRTAFYQAIFDYQTARARLMQATGQ